MLFFAIVYLVEGIGQARVGIIYQPLTSYLKVGGWTPVEVAAYFAVLNFPWIIKPVFGLVSDFVPLFGYRRKSYLIIASLCAAGAYGWMARLTEPGAVRPAAAAHLLRHGDGQHPVRRPAGGERPKLSPQQRVRQPAVAVVLHRDHGERVRRRGAGRAPPAISALQAAAGIAAVAPIAMVLASVFLSREEGRRKSAGDEADLPEHRVGCRSARLYLVAVFLFLIPSRPASARRSITS